MRECEWCGGSVVSRRADAKFCSGAHRVAAHRALKESGGIPLEMIRANRWIRYAPNKRPLRVNGQGASSTDPNTWSSYTEAVNSRAGIGLGFVLGDGIGGIDLDHCLSGNQLTAPAAEFIADYPEHYIEVSPSGEGLHIWGYQDPELGTRKTIDGLHIERYSTGRYFTVTGNVYQHGKLLPI